MRAWRPLLIALAAVLALSQAGCGNGAGGQGAGDGAALASPPGDSGSPAPAPLARAADAEGAAGMRRKAPGDGGGWDARYADVAYLLADGMAGLPEGTRPDFGFDAAGNVIAVWQFNCRVWGSRLDANTGRWEGAFMLDGGSGERFEPVAQCVTGEPVIDVRPDGQALVAWTRTDAGAGTTQIASARLNAGRWSPESVDLGPLVISGVGPLAIATDGQGETSLVFVARNSGVADPSSDGALFLGVNRGAGWTMRGFGAAGPLEDMAQRPPQLLADAQGGLHLSYPVRLRIGPSSQAYMTYYRFKSASGQWASSPGYTLPTSSYASLNSQIGVDATGRASVLLTSIYQEAGDATRLARVDLSTYAVGGQDASLGPGATLVTGATSVPRNRYAVAPVSGTQWYVGEGHGGQGAPLEARHRLPGATDWTAVELLPAGGGLADLQTAVDGADNLMVTYVSGFADGSNGSVRARRWQASAATWSAEQVIWPGAADCTRGSHRLKADAAGRVMLMCGIAFDVGSGIFYTARSLRFEP